MFYSYGFLAVLLNQNLWSFVKWNVTSAAAEIDPHLSQSLIVSEVIVNSCYQEMACFFIFIPQLTFSLPAFFLSFSEVSWTKISVSQCLLFLFIFHFVYVGWHTKTSFFQLDNNFQVSRISHFIFFCIDLYGVKQWITVNSKLNVNSQHIREINWFWKKSSNTHL